MNRLNFMREDKVTYTGSTFAKELHGKLGVVIAPIANSESGYVVNFGGKDDYVMSGDHLTPFHGKIKEDGEPSRDEKGGVEVTKRKPGGGKRRVIDQEAD
jgi:hypothetical protein